jgi:hypothetical protein
MLAAFVCFLVGCGGGQPPPPVAGGDPPPPSRVTQENFDKVQDGMTLEQVEALLGPGQDRGLLSDAILQEAEKRLKLPADTTWKRWRNGMSPKANVAAVGLSGGKVVAKTSTGL